MNTQDKPRIRCRHHTTTGGHVTTYVRSTTDDSRMAYTLVHSWDELLNLSAKAAPLGEYARFSDATIVQAAITLPCLSSVVGGKQ